MRKLRVYIDTSVFGGVFDEEFSRISRFFFEEIQGNNHIPVVSEIVLDELALAPKNVQAFFKSIKNIEIVDVNEEMTELVDKYMRTKIVPQKYYDDAFHIAIAIVSKVDVLVSWNYKHIVNLQKIRLFNSVNLVNNYTLLEIRSPNEVINRYEDKNI